MDQNPLKIALLMGVCMIESMGAIEGIRTFKLDSTLKHSVELNRHEQKRAPASNLAPNFVILVGISTASCKIGLLGLPITSG